MESFRFTDGNRGQTIIGHLYSIEEYEIDGGTYDDTANNGERWREEERRQFVAAMTLTYDDGEEALSPYIAGLEPTEVWLDSITGYWLLRDWPTESPLQARILGQPDGYQVSPFRSTDVLD